MSPRFRWHRILIITSAAVLAALVLFGAMEYTSRSSFCAGCHEMKPMYTAWQASRHAKVACIKCHTDPGAIGLVKTKTKALGEVYLHFRGAYKKPITITSETTAFSKRCLKCHEDIKGKSKPHNPTHFRMEMTCVDCHEGLVHDRAHNRRPPTYDICAKCHGEKMTREG